MKKEMSTLRLLIIGIVLSMLVISLGAFFVVDNGFFFYLGLCLGTASAILQVIHMYKTIDKTLEKTPYQAKKYAMKNYFIRNGIIIMLIIIAINYNKISFIGFLMGLFTLKLSAYFYPFLESIYKK